ncbi:MAG: DUF2244 domain-containing protein [Pseudomonadota bacterium]
MGRMTEQTRIIYLDAVLTPNRSLSPRGYRLITWLIKAGIVFSVLMLVSALLPLFSGGGALSPSLPIFGFFGLDVAALWVALRYIQRQGQEETRVVITADTVDLTHVKPGGTTKSASLPAAFARVELDEPLTPQSWLRVEHGTTAYVIGRFLTMDERKSLAVAMRAALQSARNERYAT